MNELLERIFTAYGGLERWRTVSAITVRARVGGLLPQRFAGNKLANFSVRVDVAEQHVVIDGFPTVDERAVFDRGDVRIESHDGELLAARSDARTAFFGLGAIRRNVHWDQLDVAYFAGQALWNYVTSPFLLARGDISVTESEKREPGERWRRLKVTFPPHFHTHCRHQTFYVDTEDRIRRHDFVAEPVGRLASAALFYDRYREIDGLIFPMRRRVLPRGPGGVVLPWPTLLTLDLDEIAIS